MMDPIDSKLFEDAQSVLDELYLRYPAVQHSAENDKTPFNKDLYSQINNFEATIRECKEVAQSHTVDEVIENLSVIYHMDITEDETGTAMQKLDEVCSKFLISNKLGYPVDETLLKQYRKDIELVLAVIKALQLRIVQLGQQRQWFFFPKTKLIQSYEALAEKMQTVKRRISESFNRMSRLLTMHIVESFHYIYLFFLYIIKYFISTGNQLILVEIAAVLDRFIKVVQPLNVSSLLQGENLRNSYIVYELNLLKDHIISYYE